jgi:hypothetical protein
MEMMVWNILLSAVVAIMGFLLKGKFDELERLSILLNRTREEHAKEYVTKADMHLDINRVLDRLDRLDAKLDGYMKEQRSALN